MIEHGIELKKNRLGYPQCGYILDVIYDHKE